jgi:hypothetical protein
VHNARRKIGEDGMSGLDANGLVIGRQCGTCSLCCKVFDINWLDKPKPAGKWCHNCKPGKGCAIWQSVPQKCADYYCSWRRMQQLDDSWRPDRCGFIISRTASHLPYEIIPEQGRPNSWRVEPYYSKLKRAVQSAIEQEGTLFIVISGGRHTLMLPDSDVPVPVGLENTDFRVVRDSATGKWGIKFLKLEQQSA